MIRSRKTFSIRSIIISVVIAFNVVVVHAAYTYNESLYWWLIVSLPMLLIAIRDVRQSRHAIIRNFPIVGHLRYFLESIRPELRQYFFESDLDGKPFNRRQRSIVYQRAKNEKQTVAF